LIPDTKQHEKERILRVLLAQPEWIVPETQLDVCPDPSDNRFLECAVAGGADYLVTKNIRHFPPREYAEVKIVRIRAFLRVLEQIANRNP
jgi:predicted nucleic acid-binding protein